jgi:hypothetical protein
MLISDLVGMLPPEWQHSPAWKHFQAAQAEFLTGVQFLIRDVVEKIQLPADRARLSRIRVEDR